MSEFNARMTTPPRSTLPLMRWGLLPILAASCTVTMGAFAADPGSARVLDSVEVDLGARSLIYNRVETPTLKPQPAPAPALPEPVPTEAELAAQRAWDAKEDVFLFLCCTVYDSTLTEIRWYREDGEYVFWSRINFNHFRGVSGFETQHARYTLIMGLGDEDSEALKAIPHPKLAFAQYQVVKFPPTGFDPQVATALDALHGYYGANKIQLARQFEEAEALRLEQEAWLRAHPPVPKDTVINYFPIRSSRNNGGSR